MEMKIDARRVHAERMRKAWSQEHLATLTGLGLRTIQRIEKSGTASLESVAALASVFGMDTQDLIVTESARPQLAHWLFEKRFLILLALALIAMIATPPEPSLQASATLGLWLVFEVVVAVARRRQIKL
jgi:transcriptional regulator with XRE-family HTH domain